MGQNINVVAEQELMAYLPNDDNRKFTGLYNVQRLSSSYIADSRQVVISAIKLVPQDPNKGPVDGKKEGPSPRKPAAWCK